MSIGLIVVLSVVGILVIFIGVSVLRFKKGMANYDPKKDSKNIILLNDSTFQYKISKGVALVDFWAVWCQPCKIQGPIVSDLADDMQGKAKICKIDIEKNKKVAAKLEIRNIPTIIIFKNGKEVERLVGLKTKNVLKKAIAKYL